MGLCKPFLPLHKTGIREVGGALNCSNNCLRQCRKEEPIACVFGCVSLKISVREFVLSLRSTSTPFSAPPGKAKRLPGLGAGRKNSSTDKKLKTLSLDTRMSPQSALWNASTPGDEKLVKEQKDRSNVNCGENSDDNSEVDRVVSEASSKGENLDSSSPSRSQNFPRLELPSGGESKEVSSQAAEAEFSGGCGVEPWTEVSDDGIFVLHGILSCSRIIARWACCASCFGLLHILYYLSLAPQIEALRSELYASSPWTTKLILIKERKNSRKGN